MVESREPRKIHYNTTESGKEHDWWEARENAKHQAVFAAVKAIESRQSRSIERLSFLAALYENQNILSFKSGKNYASERASPSTVRISMNVIKSCIDTLTSRIGTKKHRPMFLTEDKNWALQQRAKLLTQYMEGTFTTGGAWREGRKAFRDGLITGTGALKICVENGRIKFERVHESEIIVDEVEAMYGKPHQIHQRKYVARKVLKAKIKAAGGSHERLYDIENALSEPNAGGSRAAEMLETIESWILPSGPKAEDGRHVISIANCTLIDEPWKKDYLPFVFFKYTEKILGFYGRGLSEELAGIQLELNKLLRTIAKAMHMMSRPEVWVDEESRQLVEDMTNEIGGIRYFRGRPPIYVVPQAMSAEVYNQVENYYRKAYETSGISQLSASGMRPAGVTAKVAMRELQEIESDRFRLTEQTFEEMFMDAVPIVIDMTEDLFKNDPDLSVKVVNKKEVRMLNWANVKMNIDQYEIIPFPTSLLPSQPAAKMQRVAEGLELGLWTKDEIHSLMDYPDVEAVTSLYTASRDLTMKIIGDLLEGGEYEVPEPGLNLQQSIQITELEYLKAKRNNAPQKILSNLLAFKKDLKAFQQKAMDAAAKEAETARAAAAAAQAESGAMADPSAAMPPMAKPMPAPVSDLLPIAQ